MQITKDTEGQRERTVGDGKMMSESKISTKTIGMILELLAIPIFIINAVLLSMPNKDVRTTGILLLIANCLFIPGVILSHFPNQKGEKER